MSTIAAPMTADEFLKLLDTEEQRVELIDGEVVDMPSGGPNHEQVKANLNRILDRWLDRHGAGLVYVESAYRLDERIVQVPDLSVLGSERIKLSIDERFRGAPDLAVEVVSSETAERLQAKIRLYFKHGSKGVWSVFSRVPDRSRKPGRRHLRAACKRRSTPKKPQCRAIRRPRAARCGTTCWRRPRAGASPHSPCRWRASARWAARSVWRSIQVSPALGVSYNS
jgi:Uma2 family endonuclease